MGKFADFDPGILKDVTIVPGAGQPNGDLPGMETEPVYTAKKRANIQGNTIPGFNKDNQQFLFFCIGNKRGAKRWLRWIAPLITSLGDVLSFVDSHRALRSRLATRNPMLCSTWVNIGFSHDAIRRLVGKADADKFGDESFRQGLSERSTFLGDPTRSGHRGNRKHWKVGGPKKEADILVIVAADEPHHLKTMVNSIKQRAKADGLELLFQQDCATLPGSLRGHEHFGFKDGISQPGIRGKLSTAPGDFLTPRYLRASDDRARYFSKPGQLLLWPGQFLLGEKRNHSDRIAVSAPASSNFPSWAKHGSYLVCRRLSQDVCAFWRFAIGAATAMGITPEKFASMMVGRWPSGAPLMRSPNADNPALANDKWANNHFIFDDNTRPSNLVPISGYGGDTHAQAQADVLGKVSPHFSHIRKVNPRDAATDLGRAEDTMLRMILRRGIPFGNPLVGVRKLSRKLIKQDRGLMFICYGSTIEDQFEFLSRRWSNSDKQPNFGGHDPVIGRADKRGNRDRFIDFPTATGIQRITIKKEWVTPTGGGYFFSPPIEAIANVLGS